MIKKIFSLISTLVFSLLISVNSNAAEKWDMPMAYSATNFHSQNGVMFADAVRIATGGEIDITVTGGVLDVIGGVICSIGGVIGGVIGVIGGVIGVIGVIGGVIGVIGGVICVIGGV